MTLPPEAQASYATIIDSILKGADLNTISAKRIRKGLQAQLEYDISDQKEAINALIYARFDKQNERNEATAAPSIEVPPPPTKAATNCIKTENKIKKEPTPLPKKRSEPHDCDEQDPTPSTEQSPPPKKKIKRISQSQEEDDAAYAARLQAELNRVQGRSTRRRNDRKKPKPVAKKAKKKSATKVNSDDDSDVASGDKKPVKRTGGFHKPLNLSQPLSELLGETQLSRPQVVKQIWAYVRERELQDPSDKRQIRCDNRMHAVFKTERVQMCTMNKILSRHLYAVDE
ncbi:SWIB-domain-containing protein [Pseudovirgaria hyperparasitica]|uniref:SWIB-domain-containing protein n=1 Tax=Pseudovirgaria hyperparasitica TaxID=470096 RepID=A0A6A6VSU1_9PEZI|nr:SWIB-domain-containing protein [Pseudovirgaria hyperparasitica]KAF2752824.1 SWIB-domain-containing protein [Pseudovirgaria hyperparasitica]